MDTKYRREMSMLIDDGRVQLIGPIRQELLSGIKHTDQYEKLRLYLGAFADLSIQTNEYEKAAEFFNICRSRGIQGSNTDFLICAISNQHRLPIFTLDQDFSLYKQHLSIMLYVL
jgi:hypothetical protein